MVRRQGRRDASQRTESLPPKPYTVCDRGHEMQPPRRDTRTGLEALENASALLDRSAQSDLRSGACETEATIAASRDGA